MWRTRAHIRPYHPGDLDALYRICLLTGDDGQDATSLFHDPRLLGHFFVAPYGLFEPSLAFVAEDSEGVGVAATSSARSTPTPSRSSWKASGGPACVLATPTPRLAFLQRS